MRVLFLHPEDVPGRGEWAGLRWDLVVDLGFASACTYAEWRRRLQAKVVSIYQFSGEMDSYRWVNRVLDLARGRLLDRLGLDWWEIVASAFYKDLQMLYLVDRVREILPEPVDAVATRPHLFTRIFAETTGRSVRHLQNCSLRPWQKVAGMLRAARKLSRSQIAEIAFDKWDPCFDIRRHFSQPARLTDPVMLVPSAYSNVTRSALAYAEQLPQRRFLLAVTRTSALPERLPRNVALTSLAAYAKPAESTQEEVKELIESWQVLLRSVLAPSSELQHAARMGLWSYFPEHLENGVRLREAWRSLMQSEPVKGVLCGDDLNYYTRLPLLLCHALDGFNGIYCSHGALDDGFLFKMPSADVYLVKGEMESDYLRRARDIAPEKIILAAPAKNKPAPQPDARRSAIVFFSQPFEVENGRADEIFHELITPLVSCARQSGKRLVIKLHPFESVRGRRELLRSILPPEQVEEIEIVGGVPPQEVISQAWCGITVNSSVAVECALRNIPFFLCGWLDFGGMGYMQQFARYGVARVLDRLEDIEHIPAMVHEYRPDALVQKRLWQAADAAQLDEIMFGPPAPNPSPCAC